MKKMANSYFEYKEKGDIKMSYKKPKVDLVVMKEKVKAASGKKECSEWGCCVKSLAHY